jgi:DivIVA domain-containing protein
MLLLVLVVVLVVAGLVFGVVSLLSGDDPGMSPADPDGWARPLPNDRSLQERDLQQVRFDVSLRGYRMAQVDRVLRRTAYDLGYKDEMIAVLEAEVIALREGRREDADLLRKARESAASPMSSATEPPVGGHPALDAGSAGDDGDQVDDFALTVHGGPADGADTDWPVRPDADVTEDQPDLPREGSLRRRPAVAESPVEEGDTSASTGTASTETTALPDVASSDVASSDVAPSDVAPVKAKAAPAKARRAKATRAKAAPAEAAAAEAASGPAASGPAEAATDDRDLTVIEADRPAHA